MTVVLAAEAQWVIPPADRPEVWQWILRHESHDDSGDLCVGITVALVDLPVLTFEVQPVDFTASPYLIEHRAQLPLPAYVRDRLYSTSSEIAASR